ncbi:MAG TPA: malectin domain-containing carbohydrate-binding protein [Polyangia bacterium]|nr:malectin domain-containing carbohydrate-binding protein [Polyangia bacterium]
MIISSRTAASLRSRAARGLLVLLALAGCGGPNADDGAPGVELVQSAVTATTSGSIQINCGGPLVSPYVADVGFSGGSTVTRNNTINLSGAPNPAPASVYQSQRYGNFSYTLSGFPPSSSNTVRLHFADTHWTTAGSRVFNVAINGSTVLQNFDVVASAGAGNKAYITSFEATADASGVYVISFTTVKDAATVSGIEIYPPAVFAGTWTTVAAAVPTSLTISNRLQMQLLTDGSVLLMRGSNGVDWFRLAPDSRGRWETATWSQLASSHYSIIFNPSTMLKDGRYVLGGGEYVVGNNRSSIDLYDPVSDTWTSGPYMPNTEIGDTAASVTKEGKWYVSSIDQPETYLFNPTTNAWTKTVDIGTGGGGDEKAWGFLQNGNLLDAWGSSGSVYDSSANGGLGTWTGTLGVPVWLISPDSEIGPMSLLPSGKVVQFGASDTTKNAGAVAIYDPTTNAWTAGANAPDNLQWGDTGAVVLPNGHVLNATSTNTESQGGSQTIWEYDPAALHGGSYTIAADKKGTVANSPPFDFPLFLPLPNGQILVGDSADNHLHLYTPRTGVQSPSYRPTISSISSPSAGDFTLSGTQLNGLTTGATFGDDRNSSSNYPIVSLTDGSGNVFFARTHDFDQMAPRAGWAGSCKFTLPNAIPNGTYTVAVSASGVTSSNTKSLTVSGVHVTSLSGASVAAGSSATWTVAISQFAGTGGVVVNLASDNTAVATVPASVTVPANAASVTFTVTGRGFGTAHLSAVTATANAQFKAATAIYGWRVNSIFDTALVAAFVVPSEIAPTATTSTFVLTISRPAPTGGLPVSLSSAETGAVTLPASVTVPAGATTVNFTVTRGAFTGGHGMITASVIGDAKSNSVDSYRGTVIPTELPMMF